MSRARAGSPCHVGARSLESPTPVVLTLPRPREPAHDGSSPPRRTKRKAVLPWTWSALCRAAARRHQCGRRAKGADPLHQPEARRARLPDRGRRQPDRLPRGRPRPARGLPRVQPAAGGVPLPRRPAHSEFPRFAPGRRAPRRADPAAASDVRRGPPRAGAGAVAADRRGRVQERLRRELPRPPRRAAQPAERPADDGGHVPRRRGRPADPGRQDGRAEGRLRATCCTPRCNPPPNCCVLPFTADAAEPAARLRARCCSARSSARKCPASARSKTMEVRFFAPGSAGQQSRFRRIASSATPATRSCPRTTRGSTSSTGPATPAASSSRRT